jgi:CheY-like chemotaxis protein
MSAFPAQAANEVGSATSLVELLTRALHKVAAEAKAQKVELAWTIDPALPPYISTKRIDLSAVVLVLLHRALSVLSDSMLHLTIAGAEGNHVLIQLEDMGQSKPLHNQLWQQLVFWVDDLGGDITRIDDGLMWTIKLPLDSVEAARAAVKPGQLSVLVAIADTDVRSKIITYLRQFDHAFVESRTQRQAQELCRQNTFDMVVFDADLPEGLIVNSPKAAKKKVVEYEFAENIFVALLSNVQPMPGKSVCKAHVWLPKPPETAELALVVDAARQFKVVQMLHVNAELGQKYASG